MGDSELERAIFDTVKYFSLFDLPLTATQIWRSLIVDRAGAGVRWHGRAVPSLRQVNEALAGSAWLREHVVSRWGYFALRSAVGGEMGPYVRARLRRHALSQQKWRAARRAGRLLAAVPLVCMVAGSGSLALYSARPQSDFDFYLVVRRRRIWTARLLVLMVAQLTGRRRRYWHTEAPDKLCLNHYVTEDGLAMSPENRNVYTAQQFHQAVLLWGEGMYQQWRVANEPWLRRWLMYPPAPVLPSRQAVRLPRVYLAAKGWLERVLQEPLGDYIERWAERVQRRAVLAHTRPGQRGRVVLSAEELAFHPDSRADSVLVRFAQDEGQQVLPLGQAAR